MLQTCNQPFKLIVVLLVLSIFAHEHDCGHIRPSFLSDILKIPGTSNINDNDFNDHTSHAHTRSGRCFFSAPQTPAPHKTPAHTSDQPNWAIDPKSSLSQQYRIYQYFQ
ncbi:unnamed protein product [Orchesella dallaii]|uniref:Uncharacterized protein n=1 Tax=Orchesella dallaii TaxID=48710 RepID=A0ABP1RN41_9HEXA